MKFNIKTKEAITLSKKDLGDLISDIHSFMNQIKDVYGIKIESNIKWEVK
jgi:hypothetical protein